MRSYKLQHKNFDPVTFFMKILSLWPWPQGHPRGGDGADKNFRPISTIMPNMNEIHQRIFKIWGLINFNAKTLTLWRKDERTNECTIERKSNKSCRRTASSPAGYILYCNIFIIKPYNIGHTDLDVFVCKSFCHLDIIIQVWQFSMK